jgi:hypothetical protein
LPQVRGIDGGEPACMPETVACASLACDFAQKQPLTSEKIYL